MAAEPPMSTGGCCSSPLVTPIDESSSRLLWAVSRDFALGNRAVDQYLDGIFTDYYDRVVEAMEIAQGKGLAVLAGRSVPSVSPVPYRPLIEAFLRSPRSRRVGRIPRPRRTTPPLVGRRCCSYRLR